MNSKLSYTCLALFMILLASCSTQQETETQAEDADIDGVWEMTAYYTFDENGDSTLVDRGGHRQVKIYTDGYVMWSRTDPENEPQWYGWGGYTVENGTLKEWIEYGSLAFMPQIDPMSPFEHKITSTGNTYIQTRYENGKPANSEHYQLISDVADSEDENTNLSLEGVWEMSKLERMQNGEMEDVDRTGYRQIKMYRDGYVMWSQQVPKDSVEWFGFGRYSSIGGVLTEWMEYGSHSFMPFIGDEPFIQDLEYGDRTYKQILKDSANNEEVIEYYRRLGSDSQVAAN